MADKKTGTNGAGAKAQAAGGEVGQKAQVTKMEAVKQGLAALGNDAARPAIQAFVKKKFGIEIALDHISSCKSELVKKAAEGRHIASPAKKPATAGAHAKKAPTHVAHPATPAKKPATAGAQAASAASLARAKTGNGSHGGSVLLEDVLTAKVLVDRVGADRLKTLIDGIAK